MASPKTWWEQSLRVDGGTTAQLDKKDISIGTSATTLFEIDQPGVYRIWVKNLNATATNSFEIQGRNSTDAAWQTIVSTTSEFTTIPDSVKGFLLSSDDTIDPTALAQNEEWNGTINTVSQSYIRAISTVASGSTILKVEVR